MRKAILVLFTFLILINLGFSFDITDSNNEIRSYFSVVNSQVKVETTNNLTNFEVSYINSNSTITQNFNLTNKKGEFDIVDFFSDNSIVLKNSNLTIKVGSESKIIYVDIEKPDFSFLSSSINSQNLEVDLVFSYTDNILIDKVVLYKKVNSDLTFITNFTTQNTYSYKFEKSGNLELEFKVYDKAGNSETFEKLITIPDITKPKISTSKLVLKDGKYSLSFIVTDENLSKYEITQGTLKLLNEELSGTSKTETVNLPYESGEIEFSVYDKAGNYVSKTLSLKSPFDNDYESKFSKDKEFKFESNSNNCRLLYVDSENINEDFDKDGNEYSLELDINKIRNYEIEFYCENTNFKEYFIRDFYYDTNEPENTELEIEKDKGSLKLSWKEAQDDESEVEYILYRNDEDIYSGSKLKYTDDDVKYPNNYEYYVEVVDEAQNKVESNKVSETPDKVDVTLLTNLVKQQQVNSDTYNFRLNTDKNSQVIITVKNDLKEIFKNTYNTGNSELITQDLKLKDGINEVIVSISDEFSNSKVESFFITYNSNKEPVVVAPEKEIEKEVLPEVIPESKPDTNEEVPEDVKTYTFWLWFILWVIIIGFCLYIVFFKREILHNLVSVKRRSNKNKSGFGILRTKDIVLSRNLDKIKRARIERQREREIEKLRLKRDEELKLKRSKMVNQKHKDLSEPRLTPISFSSREKSKKSFKKIKKNNKFKEQIMSSKSKGRDLISSLKNKFSFEKKKSGIEKEDSLSEYLGRSTKKKSWEKSSDYVFKESPKEEVKEKQPKEEQIVENKKEESPKPKEPEKFNKLSLDDYLNKRTKKKRFFFAEKAVDRDLEKRERN